MAHSEITKAMAVDIIRRNNNTLGKDTLAEIRTILQLPNLSLSTVHGWWKASTKNSDSGNISESRIEKESEPSGITKDLPAKRAAEVEEKARQTLDDMYEQVTRKYLTQAVTADVIQEMKGKDLVFAAAIATDKMTMLRDIPSEILTILSPLIDTIRAKGYNPAEAFKQMHQRFSQLPDAVIIPPSHGAN